jgi:heme oxygenase
VAGVISAAMTEIDSADERNVTIKAGGMANEDHLLMVRSASAHSLIEQNFTARLGHINGEASILLRIEPEAVTVRTPEQPSDVDTSST